MNLRARVAYQSQGRCAVSDAVGGKLTVVSSGVADLQSRQVVKEALEIKGGQRRSEPRLSLVKPVKRKRPKSASSCSHRRTSIPNK